MGKVLVGTTLAAYVMDQVDTWKAWTYNWEQVKASHPDGVDYFCAIQIDGRGMSPFWPLEDRLQEIGGTYWKFLLDDGREWVTTNNRTRHVNVGQNLVTDNACAGGYSHLLFLGADTEPPPDILPKLLELNHPLVAAYMPTYGIRGKPVDGYPFPVEAGEFSSSALLIARYVFRHIRWRWDLEDGLTDDPAYHKDARDQLGIQAYVRMDCQPRHYPMCVPGIEHRGHDMRVIR